MGVLATASQAASLPAGMNSLRMLTCRCRVSSGVLIGALSGSVLLLVGCPNARPSPLVDVRELPCTSLVLGVPPIRQSKEFQCGYACFASVAMYYGVDPTRLAQGEIPEKFGKRMLTANDLTAMAGEVGLVGFAYPGNLEDLKKNLDRGRPVMVLLSGPPRTGKWPTFQWANETAWAPLSPAHWVTVIGFSNKTAEVFIHDPRQGRLAMSRGDFQRACKKHKWTSVLIGVRAHRPSNSESRDAGEP
ncbi:MAG: hypothetical protein BIFFINMI_01154 [Phycisphaerae bacterium]|nr:hypothetical protein [Phycisphaerae bacterium]